MWEEPAPEEGKEEVVDEEIVDAVNALRDEESEEPDEDGANEPDKVETIEDIASEIGWSKDRYEKGHGDSASDYIRKGDKLARNSSKGLKETKRKLESMDSAIQDIKKHYEATSKAQAAKHKKQLEALKKRRVEAIEEGDTEAVDEVEGEMSEIYNALDEPKKQDESIASAEDEMLYEEWKKENDWYSPTGKGGDMNKTLFADEVADKLSRYPDLPFERKLEIVTREVNQKFSKTASKTTSRINPVEGARPGRPKGKGVNVVLNKEEKAIGRALVNSGVMTMEQYKADVALQREA